MNDLIQAAEHLQSTLRASGQPFCFIGGLAVLRWGEPRGTRDVDATMFVGFGNEQNAITRVLGHFPARIDDPTAFARRSRVLLLQDPATDVGIDLSLGGLDFEKRTVERATFHEYEDGIDLLTCSAEDLIVLKAFADRELDWHDVKGVLIRQQGTLDFDLIRRELTPLAELKEQPEILDRLEQLFERYP